MFTKTLSALLLALASVGAHAADQAPEVQFARPDSDKTNFLSDRINYVHDIAVVVVDTASTAMTATSACLPANTSLKGRGKATLTTLDKKPVNPAKPMLVFTVNSEPEAKDTGTRRCTSGTMVRKGDVVLVEQDQLERMPPNRFGLTYGTLIVPYKYQFKGNREFSGGSTLGGYLGYREAFTGYALQYIAFIGASTVAATDTAADGTSTTRNLAGVSYGVGVLGTVKDSFQLGLVVGADRVGRGSNYVNNGKPWLAVSLGYGFSN